MESSEKAVDGLQHRVLLTGASGFIGSHVLRNLSGRAGFEVHPLSRQNRGGEWLQADITREGEVLGGYQTATGSVKVNGESTIARGAFRETDEPEPADAYSVSKMEAERAVLAIARETGLEVVIVRPVLVYGAGVKGNFRALMKLASSRLPLPVAAFNNKRSLVGVDNLADFIGVCIGHPGAANEVFLVSDGRDLSVSQLLSELSRAAGRPSLQFPFPIRLLEVTAQLFGKRAMFRRVAGSLEVDSSKARTLLHWQAPVSVSDGLKRCFTDTE